MDAAQEIPFSSMVTAMARNGVDVGIRVSGLERTWYTAPTYPGLFLPGYSEADANPDLGDSTMRQGDRRARCIRDGGGARYGAIRRRYPARRSALFAGDGHHHNRSKPRLHLAGARACRSTSALMFARS